MAARSLGLFVRHLVYAPDRFVRNVDGVGEENHFAMIQDNERAPGTRDVGNDVTNETEPRLVGRAAQEPLLLVGFGAKPLDAGIEGIGKIAEFLGRQLRSPVGQFTLFRSELVLDPQVFCSKLLGLPVKLGQQQRALTRLVQQPFPVNRQDRCRHLGGNRTRKQAGARHKSRMKQPKSAWKS